MPKNEIQKLKKEIKRLEKVLKVREKELEITRLLTDRDTLTGLYNRRGFVKESEKFLKEIQSETMYAKKRRFNIKNFSIIFVDLDGLKMINDLYGHKAGDRFIKAFGNILQKYLRDIDIVARWGGDEFVIGLVNLNEKQAYKVAKKLKSKMAQIRISEIDGRVKFGASFGIIAAKNKHRHIFNLSELIEKADLAMYRAKKEKGRGGFVIFYKNLLDKKID